MRVFVTGATGYIGHAVVKAFRAKGHRVFGMVRTEEDGNLLSLDEILPVMGDLEQPDSYRKVLDEVEVVVHCAFNYSSDKAVEHDAKAIDTILESFLRVLFHEHLFIPPGFGFTVPWGIKWPMSQCL